MKNHMNPKLAALAAALALALPAGVLAQPAGEAKAAKPAAAAPKAAAQKTFASPEEAAKALVDAVKAADAKAILAIVGPQSKSWISSGDAVRDAEDWKRFVAAYDEKNAIVKEGDAKAILNVGKDDYPFAAPLVKRGGSWAFDAEAGRQEAINRRIGRNELDTIQTMLAIVDAQREYVEKDADGNGLADYAARLVSSPGKKDGLYWPAKAGEPQSPLGPLAAQAVAEGYGKKAAAGKPQPFHGYFFRPLKGQGPHAAGGKYDYEVNGRMMGGFAVVAWPAKYGVSGVMSFVVNHDGVVFEKDLGPNTGAVAQKMTRFDPDKTWKKAQQ
ncbi:MAG: DUF2950 domain-containing protein [Burkholderiales bacterium]|nr:DUF2950 domain-containing protein [Burkholderiales bacterium]